MTIHGLLPIWIDLLDISRFRLQKEWVNPVNNYILCRTKVTTFICNMSGKSSKKHYLLLIPFLEKHPYVWYLDSDRFAKFYAVFVVDNLISLLTAFMCTLEPVLNCEYIIGGSKTNSGISNILHHNHVLIGVDQLSLEQCIVLVVEVLLVEHFMCHC